MVGKKRFCSSAEHWFLSDWNGYHGRKVGIIGKYENWNFGNFDQQKSPSGGGGHEGLSVCCYFRLMHWVQRRLLTVAQYVLEG
jgi:hypothetical protein